MGDKLKNHMIDHTGMFPHNCSTCGKGFKTCAELNNHEDTHLPYGQKYKFYVSFVVQCSHKMLIWMCISNHIT